MTGELDKDAGWRDIERVLKRARRHHDRAMRAKVDSNERSAFLSRSHRLMTEAVQIGAAYDISPAEIMLHAINTGIAEPEVVTS